MTLFTFLWPGEFGWQQLLTKLSYLVPGMFLVLLTGIVSTQLHRRPREARLLLAAIAIQLTNRWGLDRVITLALKLCYEVAGFRSTWIGFWLNTISTLLALLLFGLSWWCIVLAARGAIRSSLNRHAAENNT